MSRNSLFLSYVCSASFSSIVVEAPQHSFASGIPCIGYVRVANIGVLLRLAFIENMPDVDEQMSRSMSSVIKPAESSEAIT